MMCVWGVWGKARYQCQEGSSGATILRNDMVFGYGLLRRRLWCRALDGAATAEVAVAEPICLQPIV